MKQSEVVELIFQELKNQHSGAIPVTIIARKYGLPYSQVMKAVVAIKELTMAYYEP